MSVFYFGLLRNRSGRVTINTMTTPMIRIPSVEPITETSVGGVGVVCKEYTPCADAGA